MDPFESKYSEEFLECAVKAEDSVYYTNNRIFECAVYGEDDEDDVYEEKYCYEIWAAACLYDSMLNGTPYSHLCIGYEKAFDNALEKLKKDISKKKFLSKKPVYDISSILQNAVDALDVVNGTAFASELAEKMKADGLSEKFERSISDLQNNLAKHIEE